MAPTHPPVLEILSYEHLPHISIKFWFATTRWNSLFSHPVLAVPISYFWPVILFLPLLFVLTLCSSTPCWLVPRPSNMWAGRPQTGVIWHASGIWFADRIRKWISDEVSVTCSCLLPVLSTFLLLPIANSCVTAELLQSLEVLHSRLACCSHRLSLKPLNKVGLKLGTKGWFPLITEDLASGVLRYHLRKWLEQLANDWAKSAVTTGETCCLAGEWQLSASSQNVTSVCRLQIPERIVGAKVPFINVLPKLNNLKVHDGVWAFISYLFKTIKTDLS